MRIIISPAKQMKEDTDTMAPAGLPVFIDRSEILKNWIQRLSFEQQEHLRILSGFYGVVKPMDGVALYRLEMQSKIDLDGCRNLYDFWGDALYQEVMDESRTIINLALKEYSKL